MFLRELPVTARVLRGRWGSTLVRMKPGCGNMKQFGGEYVAVGDLNLVEFNRRNVKQRKICESKADNLGW